MDPQDYTLHKISKKYTNASTKNWERPTPQVVAAIERVLQINRSKALEPLARSKRFGKTSRETGKFIEEFTARLSKTKMPRRLDSRDFDYDYQVQRQQFLEALCSKEIGMVDGLHDALEDELVQLKDVKEYVKSYEKLYRDELKKLEEFDGSDLVQRVQRNEQNQVRSMDIEENDDELNEILNELDTQLEKLDKAFDPLQELSTKLDETIQLLER